MNVSSGVLSGLPLGPDPLQWSILEGLIFGSAVVFGQIAIDGVLEVLFNNRFIGKIPVGGFHLDVLGTKDIAFICFNRTITALFSYHLLLFCLSAPKISWGWSTLSLSSTVVPYLLFFVMYDAGYSLFHRFLHHRSVYALVHKHHHRQCAPSRGNVDACNTHPVEYVSGEYLHLLVFWAIPGQVHIGCVGAIVITMGILASLNHTRFDVKAVPPLVGWLFSYSVSAHDMHHHFITANYGQYTMLWDLAMGTFRPSPSFTEVAAKDGVKTQ